MGSSRSVSPDAIDSMFSSFNMLLWPDPHSNKPVCTICQQRTGFLKIRIFFAILNLDRISDLKVRLLILAASVQVLDGGKVCRWILVILSAKICIRLLRPLSVFISYFTLSTILLTVLYGLMSNCVCQELTPSPYEKKRAVWSGLPGDLFPTPSSIHHVIQRLWKLDS